VGRRSDGAELALAQHHCQRRRCKRNQHQQPEDVHTAEIRRLRVQLLSDPLDGPVLGTLDGTAWPTSRF
jgi:hypothetical protein